MRIQAPLLRNVSATEATYLQVEEKQRLKEAAEKVQKELEDFCPSVHYPVHGTYCWRSMITEGETVL
jgi:hypothetical protein